MSTLAKVLETRKPPSLFHGLVLDNSLTMISAPPYTGKSLIVGAMILSLDFGIPLFGKLAPNGPRRVLAFLQDAPPWDYAEQLRKLSRGYGLTADQRDMSETEFHFETSKGLAYEINGAETHEVIQAYKPDVVFFDAFWTTHNYNENNKAEMKPVMQMYKRLRDDGGFSVIFTHHDIKPRQDSGGPMVYRSSGSHVIAAACDNQLFLSRRAGNKIAIQAGKARGGNMNQHVVEIEDVDHPDGEAIRLRLLDDSETRTGRLFRFIVEAERTRTEVIEYLRSIEPRLQAATATRAVEKTLAALLGQGKIVRSGHGKYQGTS